MSWRSMLVGAAVLALSLGTVIPAQAAPLYVDTYTSYYYPSVAVVPTTYVAPSSTLSYYTPGGYVSYYPTTTYYTTTTTVTPAAPVAVAAAVPAVPAYTSYYPSWYYTPVDTYAYQAPANPGYASFYYRPQTPAPAPATLRRSDTRPKDNSAHMLLHVPADALVWFNGEPTNQTGPEREFISPPLDPGAKYSYNIVARWNGPDGQPVVERRKVEVAANAWEEVNLTRPPANVVDRNR